MICQAKFRSNCIGEYVVGVFTGGLYQGEVVKVDGENVTVDFLKPVFLKQNNEESCLWKIPPEYHADRQAYA